MKRLARGKEARERFVASALDKNLATQIRAIRDRQGLSQEELAELAGGMNQNAISRLESPRYGRPTITTLKRLAAAFDVGLSVRFVPFSQMADWASGTPYLDMGHSTEAFAVPNFSEELEAVRLQRTAASHPAQETYPIVAETLGTQTLGVGYVGSGWTSGPYGWTSSHAADFYPTLMMQSSKASPDVPFLSVNPFRGEPTYAR